MTREEKNHQAYMDVIERKGPTMLDDDEYIQFYQFWRALLPDEEF